ncbi:MAG TPA: sensor histidine kinase [Caulobacteraceae bacterium]|jgi:two-component sensor histidine kinase
MSKAKKLSAPTIDRRPAYDILLEDVADGFAVCEAIWDAAGELSDCTILEMNSPLRRMLGAGPEAIGTRLSESLGDHSAWLRVCQNVLKTGEPASFEFHTATRDIWHEVRVTRVTADIVAQLFFNITERKHAELRQGRLFDELNHRVSNNLALVASILDMNATQTGNGEVREQLLRAANRVHGIAQVHRALYQRANRDVVEFSEYLYQLCKAMSAALGDDGRIKIEVEAEPVSVPTDTAIALGMVVNELITNSSKYAYPHPAGGVVSVQSSGSGDTLLLRIRDHGRGLGDDSGGRRAGAGLGLRLVKSLVAQVNGELTIDGPPGFTVIVELPLRQPDARPRSREDLSARERC